MIFLKFNKILLFLNTIKYLKISQIFYKIYYTINYIPFNVKKNHPRTNSAPLHISFLPKPKSTFDFDEFTFLNKTFKLSKIGWDNKKVDKLWKYNLHYFDFINSIEITDENILKVNSVIKLWIDNNPIGKGTGWEPYPTSIRIINLVKWQWKTVSLSNLALTSLWNQSLWLNNHIEFHLLGNHILTNAKALAFSGYLFQGSSSKKILLKSKKILKKQINEQFLIDGAHFELSPMYHSICLEDLLDIYNLFKYNNLLNLNMIIAKKVNLALNWLKDFSYQNEEIANFNDCSNGISQPLSNLKNYTEKLGLQIKYLNDNNLIYYHKSGYIIFKKWDLKLIADLGNIGPNYIPGHAHADTLSFELSIGKNRIFVNSGTSHYEKNMDRHLQRSTKSHSTVEINGENSSQVWSGFRVANRAVIKNLVIHDNAPININFNASHNGYNSCFKKLIHNRNWHITTKSITISDQIFGKYNFAVSRFYIYPDILPTIENEFVFLEKNNIKICKISVLDKLGNFKKIEIVNSEFNIEFGRSIPNKHLSINFDKTSFLKLNIEIL
jgi:uncharacterized heparinase superfamily protein